MEGPIDLANRLTRERQASIAANVERWRKWMATELPAILERDDGAVSGPSNVAMMFPIGGMSRSNPDAPRISRGALREAVQGDEALGLAMRVAFARQMIAFGLRDRGDWIEWRTAPRAWALGRTYDRRIYRILRSAHSAGLESEARKLMAFLERELGPDVQRHVALSFYRHQVAS